MPSSVSTSSRSGRQSNRALREMERHIDELPLLPQVLVRILQLDPMADDYFEQFEKLAKEDPAFAVRIVALANSAASSPAVPICTIRDALTRMGAGTVSNLVASLSVQRVFMPTEPAQIRLWKHSIETAVTSQTIARLLPVLVIEPAEAYLAGLLHDIGRFVMLEHSAPELRRVEESEWKSPEELVQADVDIYNYTHSELGNLACQHWGLPESIAMVVKAHHDDIAEPIQPGSAASTICCVQIADRISIQLLGEPSEEELTDAMLEQLLLERCLHTGEERNAFPASVLCKSIAAVRTESQRLIADLGFS